MSVVGLDKEPGARQRQKVQLRVRLSCSTASPEAEVAWNEFLFRLLRKTADE